MRLHRFYVSQPLGEEVVINDVSLVNQWKNVFRYTVEDVVIIFNGDGFDYHYSLQSITKGSCTLTRLSTKQSYIPSQKITLCLSLIKKDAFELTVQKATELGVTSCVPLLSARSEKKNISVDRLQKIMIEASEQCCRGDIPELLPITTLPELLDTLSDSHHAVFLNAGGSPLIEAKNLPKDKEIFVFIGPEGGWSEEELALVEERGLKQYSLTSTTLRAETAAIATCAFLIL